MEAWAVGQKTYVLFSGIEREKSVRSITEGVTLYRAPIDKFVCLSMLPVSCYVISNKAFATAQTKRGSIRLNTLTSLTCTALHTGLSKSLQQPNAGWQRGISLYTQTPSPTGCHVSKVLVHLILSHPPPLRQYSAIRVTRLQLCGTRSGSPQLYITLLVEGNTYINSMFNV